MNKGKYGVAVSETFKIQQLNSVEHVKSAMLLM